MEGSHLFGLTKSHKGGFESFADLKFCCLFVGGLWAFWRFLSKVPTLPLIRLWYLPCTLVNSYFKAGWILCKWDDARHDHLVKEKYLSLLVFFFFLNAHGTKSKFTSCLREPSRPGHLVIYKSQWTFCQNTAAELSLWGTHCPITHHWAHLSSSLFKMPLYQVRLT